MKQTLTPTIALLVREMRARRAARLHYWNALGRNEEHPCTFVTGLDPLPRRINPRTARAMRKGGLLDVFEKDWRRTIYRLAPKKKR